MTLIQYDVFLCSIVLSSACELLTTLTCNPERWIGPGTSCLFSGDLFKQHFTTGTLGHLCCSPWRRSHAYTMSAASAYTMSAVSATIVARF